jgi:hypothetical protein
MVRQVAQQIIDSSPELSNAWGVHVRLLQNNISESKVRQARQQNMVEQ